MVKAAATFAFVPKTETAPEAEGADPAVVGNPRALLLPADPEAVDTTSCCVCDEG